MNQDLPTLAPPGPPTAGAHDRLMASAETSPSDRGYYALVLNGRP